MNIRSAMVKRHRFNLSARDIEDLLSERGTAVSYGVAHRELIPEPIHDSVKFAAIAYVQRPIGRIW